MTFVPFTPPEPERHPAIPERRYHTLHDPITTSAQLKAARLNPANTTGGTRKHFPRWAVWLISITVFVILWWVSMDFRGLVMVLGVFWFFALGAHPITHFGRAAHDLFDGDN